MEWIQLKKLKAWVQKVENHKKKFQYNFAKFYE